MNRRRRNPAEAEAVVVRIEFSDGKTTVRRFAADRWRRATMNTRDRMVDNSVGGRSWARWDEIVTRSNPSRDSEPRTKIFVRFMDGTTKTTTVVGDYLGRSMSPNIARQLELKFRKKPDVWRVVGLVPRSNPSRGTGPSRNHGAPAGVVAKYIGGMGDDEYSISFNGTYICSGYISPRGGGEYNWAAGSESGIADGVYAAETKMKAAALRFYRAKGGAKSRLPRGNPSRRSSDFLSGTRYSEHGYVVRDDDNWRVQGFGMTVGLAWTEARHNKGWSESRFNGGGYSLRAATKKEYDLYRPARKPAKRHSNPATNAWVVDVGRGPVTVRAGDRIEYYVQSPHGVHRKRTATVLRFLVFDDHVMTSGSNNGDYVDDGNFIRVVRKG